MTTYTDLFSDDYEIVTTSDLSIIKSLWDKGKPKSYQFKYRNCCAMTLMPVYTVMVTKEGVVSGDNAPDPEYMHKYISVDTLLKNALERSKSGKFKCAYQFNKTVGVLISESCEPVVKPQFIGDDEFISFGFNIFSFSVHDPFLRRKVNRFTSSCIYGEWRDLSYDEKNLHRAKFDRNGRFEYWDERKGELEAAGTFSIDSSHIPYRLEIKETIRDEMGLGIFKCITSDEMMIRVDTVDSREEGYPIYFQESLTDKYRRM